MAKSKVILKKKAQEKIVPAPPQEESSSSSELNEDEAENSHPLANSTTRGTPVTGALNKTAAKNNKVFLDEEETESSEDETQGLKTNKKRQSKSEKAGLQFPVSRIHRKLKNGGYSDRTSDSGSVYLAATLEYLVSEITEISGDIARNSGRVRITPRHVQLAIRSDAEFDQLLGSVIIPSSGVPPNINPVLMSKPTTKQVKATKSSIEPGTSQGRETTKGAGKSKEALKTLKTKIPQLTAGKKRKNQNESEATVSKARK